MKRKFKNLKFAVKYFLTTIKNHKKENVYTLTYTTTNTPVSVWKYAFETSKIFFK